MKNITFSADEHLIDAARNKAKQSNRTLNDEFRDWLAAYVAADERAKRAEATLTRLFRSVGTGGRKFTREEMNER